MSVNTVGRRNAVNVHRSAKRTWDVANYGAYDNENPREQNEHDTGILLTPPTRPSTKPLKKSSHLETADFWPIGQEYNNSSRDRGNQQAISLPANGSPSTTGAQVVENSTFASFSVASLLSSSPDRALPSMSLL